MTHSPSSFLRPRSVSCSPKSGFTLIELLMVIAIMVILASITFGIARGVYNAQARSTAKAELATIAQAIEQFKLTYGDYPWHDSSTGSYPKTSGEVTNTMLMYALTGRMTMERQSDGTVKMTLVNKNLNDATVKKNPSFIDPTKFTTSGTEISPEAFLDPWGKPYKYWYKWSNTPDDWEVFGYHLYSTGPDTLDDDSKIEEKSGIIGDDYREVRRGRDTSVNIDNIFVGE
ncbi:MAG: type IV pilin protein [Opitutaceae bacterium]